MFRRAFSSTSRRTNLFGEGKTIRHTRFEAPSGKGQTAANPVDLLKKNDILMFSNKPLNYIESIKDDGFHLSSRIYIKSPNDKGDIIGALMLESEAFEVNLGQAGVEIIKNGKAELKDSLTKFSGVKLINGFMVEFNDEILEIFDKINPKPDILVIGLGRKSRMLSDKNKKFFSSIGIQLEVGDSFNSAKVFDLLATERPNTIGALLLPPNL